MLFVLGLLSSFRHAIVANALQLGGSCPLHLDLGPCSALITIFTDEELKTWSRLVVVVTGRNEGAGLDSEAGFS